MSSAYVTRFLLGTELARLRAQTGLSLDDVERELEFEASWLSRVERAERGMKARDVRLLLDLYSQRTSIPPEQREELIQLSRNAVSGKRDWWRRYRRALKPKFDVLLAAESGASVISAYHSHIIPGLLQTEAYARGVMKATDIDGVADVDEVIGLRHTRQGILTREQDPVQLHVVLDEAVIRREVGGPAVMREQLQRLIELIRLPTVKIQVLRFTAGAHPAMNGEFTLLVFRVSDDLGMVYLETATSGLVLQSEAEVRRYNRIFGTLMAKALSPEESVALIASMAQEENK